MLNPDRRCRSLLEQSQFSEPTNFDEFDNDDDDGHLFCGWHSAAPLFVWETRRPRRSSNIRDWPEFPTYLVASATAALKRRPAYHAFLSLPPRQTEREEPFSPLFCYRAPKRSRSRLFLCPNCQYSLSLSLRRKERNGLDKRSHHPSMSSCLPA